MKKLIFIGSVLMLSPAFAQQEEEQKVEDQNKLEIRQSQTELTEEYQNKVALLKNPDDKYLPMNRFINSGRRR